MELKNDAPEVIETPAPVEETVETPEESLEDKVVRLEKEKADIEDKNKKLYARIKKDEKPVEKPAQEQQTLSPADIIALSKVHEDDVEEAVEFAKYKKISVREALKRDDLKAILGDRAEKRETANSANVSNVRRTAPKVTGETLLDNARSGKLPEDEKDIVELVKARAKIR